MKKLVGLLLLLSANLALATDPVPPSIYIPGKKDVSTPQIVNQAVNGSTIQVKVGRFLPIIPTTANPRSYVTQGDAGIFVERTRKPGHPYNGIKFDEIDKAEEADYTPTTADGKLPPTDVKILVAKKPGKQVVYTLENGDDAKGVPPKFTAITLEVIADGPTPPKPDDPTPKPVDPADADPLPGTAGNKVLMIYDAADQSKLTANQRMALYSADVRKYLNSKCIADAGTPMYRIYPDGTDTTNEAKVWQTAMGIKRTSVPWIVISNGKTGYSGPLPDSDPLTLLKKYFGD